LDKKSLTDNVINAILYQKEERVFTILYESFFPELKRYIRKNGGSYDDALDVFQEGVLILFKYVKMNKFNQVYTVDAYLFIICKNLWIRKAKENFRNVELDHPSVYEEALSAPSLHEAMESEEREKNILSIFAQLGERCHQLLKATIYDNMTMAEIKENLNFASEDAAKTKHYKCKQRLIELVKDNLYFKDLLTQV
jgi:RNA polymerase sigma factor (sigma-70 family)